MAAKKQFHAKPHRLYVGTAPGSIHAYDMDAETGVMTAIGGPTEQDGAGSFLAPSADGRFLFAAAKPAVASFSISKETGALSHINTVQCDVPGNAHISLATTSKHNLDPRVAILASYGGGAVNAVTIREDGSLAKASSIVHSGGSGVHQDPGAQDGPHPHSGFIDPTGRRVLVSDLGQDKVYVYNVDLASGKLTEHSVLETAPGAGPRHVCFHPRRPWVYGINELDCTIICYQYKTGDGKLVPVLPTVSTLPEGYDNRDHANAKNAEGEKASGPNRTDQTNATADIHITPDGRFLYGSNRGHDSLVCFKIERDGALTLVGFTPTKGEHPRNFGIHPSGDWILVANQDSNNVVLFKVDKKTGALTQTGPNLEMTQPRCVQWALIPKPLRKPKWTTVEKVKPDSKGVNLFAKVVKVSPAEGADSESDVVVGDGTGVVTVRVQAAQLSHCEVGKVLRIQNARTFITKGFLRLKVDMWGVLAAAPADHEDIEPKTSPDISAVEYELSR